MIICLCKGITEEDLIRAGSTCSTSQEVIRKLGVAQDCGVCLITALEKLNGGKMVTRSYPQKF